MVTFTPCFDNEFFFAYFAAFKDYKFWIVDVDMILINTKYSFMNKYIILVFVFAISLLTKAQNEPFLKNEFIYKGDTLHYRVLFPVNYDRAKSYPLVLFLHGSGERGNDNEKQLVHGAALFLDSLNRVNYPAIVLFPQCPNEDSWVKIEQKEPGIFNFVKTKAATQSLGLAYEMIKYYKKNEAVDAKRIYVSGLSLGGMGTYDLICRYSNTFAAAVPICGGVNLERLKSVRRLPIRIFHGTMDSAVSVEYSRDAYIELKANGSQAVEFKEYPGVGHDSWTNAFAEPDFLSWMFSKHK